MTTVSGGLRHLTTLLKDAGLEQPAREARLLLAHVLEVAPDRLVLHLEDPLSEGALRRGEALAQRRRRGEPMSHLVGYRAFWGRRFAVDARALDPRPETEGLIAAALEAPFERVLDLGLGSGCILLTLLAERGSARGVGADISEEALALAAQNAAALAVMDRVEMCRSDWFEAVEGRFDLIVANPPYIALDEMDGLAAELAHEPRLALTDEGDGLEAYRRITAGVGAHLAPGGRLLLEIGPTQGAAVRALVEGAGLGDVEIRPDFDGRDRVVLGRA